MTNKIHGGRWSRQYYEGVGALPPRPRPPLWRSPSPERTPRDGDPNDRRKEDIAAHKTRISRHRHHWSPPRTPPGYWKIGFPDTQEVAVINEKARQMHQ